MNLWTIGNIADRLGVRPELVRQWKARGKLPEPTATLAQSPVWEGRVIEPWLSGYERGRDALERERAARIERGE